MIRKLLNIFIFTIAYILLSFINHPLSDAEDVQLDNNNGTFTIPEPVSENKNFDITYNNLHTDHCYALTILNSNTQKYVVPVNTQGVNCAPSAILRDANNNTPPIYSKFGGSSGKTLIQGLQAGSYAFVFYMQPPDGCSRGPCMVFAPVGNTIVIVAKNNNQPTISAKVCIKTNKSDCSNQGYMSDTYILAGTVNHVDNPKNITVSYQVTSDTGLTYGAGRISPDSKGNFSVDFSRIIQGLKNVQLGKDTGNKLNVITTINVNNQEYRSSPAYFTVLDFSPVQGSDDNCTKVSVAALSDCVVFPKDKKQYDADPAISCQTNGQFKCSDPDNDHFCASNDNHVMCQANDIPTIPVLPPCHQWSVNGKLQPTMPPVDSLKYADAMDKITNAKGDKSCVSVETAVGDLSVNPGAFITSIFSVLLGIAGGLALILIIYSGYQIILSRGDPEKLKVGRERLLNTIIGLVFIICSMVILQFIAGDLLRIPGFGT